MNSTFESFINRWRSTIYSLRGFRGKVGCGAPYKSLKVSGTVADGLADSCSWVVPSSLKFFFCVEDAVDGGGPQPLGAIEVEGGVVPGLVPPDRRP